jgi:hypothetical protein
VVLPYLKVTLQKAIVPTGLIESENAVDACWLWRHKPATIAIARYVTVTQCQMEPGAGLFKGTGVAEH